METEKERKEVCPICQKTHKKKWLLYSKDRKKFFCIRCYIEISPEVDSIRNKD